MHPKYLSISDFTYQLPGNKIAIHPLPERDRSKLLVYKSGNIQSSSYNNIDQFLPSNSLLIFNNTRVVEARLLFKKATGGAIEIFCLEPSEQYADITSAMLAKGEAFWKCLIGGASKWKHGSKLEKSLQVNDTTLHLEAEIIERLTDSFIVKLNWTPAELSFADILHYVGIIPLPPYLHRESVEEDNSRYQTIYAANDGSVAAPTAGLHFTEKVFDKIAAKNIEKDFVTLHVGAGTFKPVKSDTMNEHNMHAEFIEATATTIKTLIAYSGKDILAVGTTSLRTIESLYWLGVKTNINPNLTTDELLVDQWEPYDHNSIMKTNDALKALLKWMEQREIERIITKTKILIAPGYKLRVAKGIVTNFHQPNSTLLLLVAAIVGGDWRKIYNYALANDYRFLSYGDGCLLWQNEKI